jgi:hypothetical protein
MCGATSENERQRAVEYYQLPFGAHKKPQILFIIVKVLAPIAVIHQMIHRSRELDSQFAGHAPKRTSRRAAVSTKAMSTGILQRH